MPRKKWNDLYGSLSPERREKIDRWVREESERLGLNAVRHEAGLSQQQLADALGINQGSVSKTENAADMNISTLRRYVEAMGGKLRITVDMPDGRSIDLGDLGDLGGRAA